MKCFLVDRDRDGNPTAAVVDVDADQLPAGDVIVQVDYSSLNYKDALAATGTPGVALDLPLVPGIDAAGKVVQSKSDSFRVGDQVILAHEDLGTRLWGGWSQRVSAPAGACIRLPATLSSFDAMALGTAGYTAAQSVDKILAHGVAPQQGPVLVTGATGGVGIIAVKLLAQLGFHVVASTGKQQQHDWLMEHGAQDVIDRGELIGDSGKPLLPAKWAAAVDTVGGSTLATVIRSGQRGSIVTCCGMVGGKQLELTVFPFILRGVNLQGIDSAGATQDYRQMIWDRLGGEWMISDLESLTKTVPLSEISVAIPSILKGQISGRVVVQINED